VPHTDKQETPRTDALLRQLASGSMKDVLHREWISPLQQHAEQLERDLIAAQTQLRIEQEQGSLAQEAWCEVKQLLDAAQERVAELEQRVEPLWLCDLRAELQKAVAKFPTWPTDPIHACQVVGEEVGELYKEVLQLTYEPHKSSKDAVRKEAVQAMAMIVRFYKGLDVYEYTPGPQHKQEE